MHSLIVNVSYGPYLVSAIILLFWMDSRLNYPATIRIRPDSENPYLVHP